MSNQKESKSYAKEITTTASAADVFAALSEKINLWWSKTDTSVSKVGDEFTIYFEDASWSFNITEYVPNSKITWECIDGKPDFNVE